jgi:hypothetical protein
MALQGERLRMRRNVLHTIFQRSCANVYYVRIQMAIAVVRTNSLLIRGCRDRQRPRHPAISDQHAMNNWVTWSEQ